jgi:hypothetical protein
LAHVFHLFVPIFRPSASLRGCFFAATDRFVESPFTRKRTKAAQQLISLELKFVCAASPPPPSPRGQQASSTKERKKKELSWKKKEIGKSPSGLDLPPPPQSSIQRETFVGSQLDQ